MLKNIENFFKGLGAVILLPILFPVILIAKIGDPEEEDRAVCAIVFSSYILFLSIGYILFGHCF